MTNAEILEVVKTDLQLAVDTMDSYLIGLIERATAAVTREGMTVTASTEDGMIIAAYAAFLYRHRRENNVRMPQSLRWELNNRIFSEKMGDSDGN